MEKKDFTSIKVSLITRDRLAQLKYAFKMKDYDTLLMTLLRAFDPSTFKKEEINKSIKGGKEK